MGPEPASLPPAYAVAAPAPARLGPDGRALATTSVRVAAYVTDSVLLSLFTVFVWYPLASSLGLAAPTGADRAGDQTWLVTYGMSILIDALYFIALWSGGRRTVGMRLFRLEVVRAADAATVPVVFAALRWGVLYIPGLLIGFVDLVPPSDLLGFVVGIALGWAWTIVLLASVVLSPTRQGLHDRAAGTVVVTR